MHVCVCMYVCMFVGCCLATKTLNLNNKVEWVEVIMGVAVGC